MVGVLCFAHSNKPTPGWIQMLDSKLSAKGLLRWALRPNLDNAENRCWSCCHGNRPFLVSCTRCSHPKRCNNIQTPNSTLTFGGWGGSSISLVMSPGAEPKARMVERGARQTYPYIDHRKGQHPTALQAYNKRHCWL